MNDSEQPKLELDYPCRWEYRVIGAEESRIRSAIAEILGDRPYDARTGRRSEGGKWITVVVDLEVHDDEDRTSTYRRLLAQPAVRVIL